jgi:UDP-3-O-[3-hydroxymyristoyl] glucosamine N-acyltransferase
MSFTAAEIAQHLQGEVLGDSGVVLENFATADHAQSGDLTFAENALFLARAEQSAATAIIVGPAVTSKTKVLIRVQNARVAFAKALALFFPEPVFSPGVHPSAVIASDAEVDPSAHIGPHCVIGSRSKIGPRVALLSGVCVAEGCQLGEDVVLFPNVTLYPQTILGQRVRIHSGTVIGSDGFGYVLEAGVHRKVQQVGNVIIGDDVEIGACVTIDRGAIGPTVIGKGTKIDNLVQLGHNVRIGEHCLLVAQAAVAGSSKLGNYVVLAGQTGIAGHLELGNRAVVAAQSGVMHNIPEGETWWGAPAQPTRETKRQVIALRQLPELLKRVARLERKLGGELPKDPNTQIPKHPSDV